MLMWCGCGQARANRSPAPKNRLAAYAALTNNETRHFWSQAQWDADQHHSVTGVGSHEAVMSVRRNGTGFRAIGPNGQDFTPE